MEGKELHIGNIIFPVKTTKTFIADEFGETLIITVKEEDITNEVLEALESDLDILLYEGKMCTRVYKGFNVAIKKWAGCNRFQIDFFKRN